MPKYIPVIATCRRTGREHYFASVAEAVAKGGFDKNAVHHCIQGLQKYHVGHTFRAAGDYQYKPSGRILEVKALMDSGHNIQEMMAILGLKFTTVSVLACHARKLEPQE